MGHHKKQKKFNRNRFTNLWKQNHSAYYQYRFNHSFVNAFDYRNIYMKRLIHAKGLFKIKPPFYCIYGKHIMIGRDFTCGHNAFFEDDADIIIQNHVQMGNNVKLLTVRLDYEADKQPTAEAIMIEDYVYIGNDVTVLPGVTIHKGAIVGDGCIISEDIEANTMVSQEQSHANKKQVMPDLKDQPEANTKMEAMLDHVNLDKVDALIRAAVLAGSAYCAYKAAKLLTEKKAVYDEKKAVVEKYIPMPERYEKGSKSLKKLKKQQNSK